MKRYVIKVGIHSHGSKLDKESAIAKAQKLSISNPMALVQVDYVETVWDNGRAENLKGEIQNILNPSFNQ